MKYQVRITSERRRNVFRLLNANGTTIPNVFGGVYGYANSDRSLAAVETEMVSIVGEENRSEVKKALSAAVASL